MDKNNSKSRSEAILENMLGANHELENPKSRIEVLLIQLLNKITEITSVTGSAFRLLGEVMYKGDLPDTDQEIGDVWFVSDESTGYIWMTSEDYPEGYWEPIGETFDVTSINGLLFKVDPGVTTYQQVLDAISSGKVPYMYLEESSAGGIVISNYYFAFTTYSQNGLNPEKYVRFYTLPNESMFHHNTYGETDYFVIKEVKLLVNNLLSTPELIVVPTQTYVDDEVLALTPFVIGFSNVVENGQRSKSIGDWHLTDGLTYQDISDVMQATPNRPLVCHVHYGEDDDGSLIETDFYLTNRMPDEEDGGTVIRFSGDVEVNRTAYSRIYLNQDTIESDFDFWISEEYSSRGDVDDLKNAIDRSKLGTYYVVTVPISTADWEFDGRESYIYTINLGSLRHIYPDSSAVVIEFDGVYSKVVDVGIQHVGATLDHGHLDPEINEIVLTIPYAPTNTIVAKVLWFNDPNPSQASQPQLYKLDRFTIPRQDVVTDSGTLQAALSPNKVYVFSGQPTSLTLTFAETFPDDFAASIYQVFIYNGNTPVNLVLPNTVDVGDFVPEANKISELNIQWVPDGNGSGTYILRGDNRGSVNIPKSTNPSPGGGSR